MSRYTWVETDMAGAFRHASERTFDPNQKGCAAHDHYSEESVRFTDGTVISHQEYRSGYYSEQTPWEEPDCFYIGTPEEKK